MLELGWDEEEPVHRVELHIGAAKELVLRPRQWLRKAGLVREVIKLNAEIDFGRGAGGVGHRIHGNPVHVTQASPGKLDEVATDKIDRGNLSGRTNGLPSLA